MFDHSAGDLHDLDLLRAAINKITKKNHLSLGVLPYALLRAVTQFGEQRFQLGGMAVDVADQIVQSFPSMVRGLTLSSILRDQVRLRQG